MATAGKTEYALLRVLDAATGHVSDTERAALRADVHAALGVDGEADHAERVSETARDNLGVAPAADDESAGDDGPPAD